MTEFVKLVARHDLQQPIDFRLLNANVQSVVEILCCFQYVDLVYDLESGTGDYFNDHFEAPVEWLAIMIALRSPSRNSNHPQTLRLG
jgi:hypothetical protein